MNLIVAVAIVVYKGLIPVVGRMLTPQGLVKENTAAIGEDDFLSANPIGA